MSSRLSTSTTFKFQIRRIPRTLASSRCSTADKETLETRLVRQAVIYEGEQGWRSGRVLAFHQCGPGSIPGLGVISGLSLLVLYSAPRGFSPGTPVFPSPEKLTFDLI